jgi:hypothetical protein
MRGGLAITAPTGLDSGAGPRGWALSAGSTCIPFTEAPDTVKDKMAGFTLLPRLARLNSVAGSTVMPAEPRASKLLLTSPNPGSSSVTMIGPVGPRPAWSLSECRSNRVVELSQHVRRRDRGLERQKGKCVGTGSWLVSSKATLCKEISSASGHCAPAPRRSHGILICRTCSLSFRLTAPKDNFQTEFKV